MPTLALFAPVALPLAASAITVVGGLAGLKPGRAIVGTGAWAALAALLVVWFSVRSTQ